MEIDKIFDLWNEDSVIDQDNLEAESLKISQLHHKYYKILVLEAVQFKKLENDMKSLKLAKYEFYADGPSKETKELGWDYPLRGKLLKTEIPSYMDGDQQIIELNTKMFLQQQKIDLLTSIIKNITDRQWNIKNALESMKFKVGQ